MTSTRRIILGGILGAFFAVLINVLESLGDWSEEKIQLLIFAAVFIGVIVAWLGPMLVYLVTSMDTRDIAGGPACFALMIIVLLFGSLFFFSLLEWWARGNFLIDLYIDSGIISGLAGGATALVMEKRLQDV